MGQSLSENLSRFEGLSVTTLIDVVTPR